jgi:hypothetical protein
MHGMDIGSMPFFREMIQGGIKKVISSYVTPKFITLDIAAILDRQRQARTYVVSLLSFISLYTPSFLFLTDHCFFSVGGNSPICMVHMASIIYDRGLSH